MNIPFIGKRLPAQSLFDLWVRIGIGGIFIWAGAIKLMNPSAFGRTLAEFGLVPRELLAVVAVGLPALECLAGIGLLMGSFTGIMAVGSLLAVFLGVLGYGIFNRLEVDCGCFSVEETAAGDGVRTAFVRDVFLLGAVIYLFTRKWLRRKAVRAQSGEPE